MSVQKTQKVLNLISSRGLLRTGYKQSGDIADGGFVLEYNNSTTPTFAGLIRHATDDTFYLFKGLQTNPFASNGDIVNPAGTNFTKANLLLGSLNSSTGITIASGGLTVDGTIQQNSGNLSTVGTATAGNLRLGTNQLISTNTNGNISILPNGSGQLILGAIGNQVLLPQDPTTALQAATKQYVDNVASGITYKAPCRVATTADLATVSGGIIVAGAGPTHTITKGANGAISGDNSVFDSVSLALNDRVLVKNQGDTGGNARDNGIYYVSNIGSAGTPWVLTRTSDADNSGNGNEVVSGDTVLISEGTSNATTGYILATVNPIVLDTTALSWVQNIQAGTVTGNNLSNAGQTVFRDKTGVYLNFRDIISTNISGSNSASNILEGTQNTTSILLNLDQSKITGTGALNSGSITSGFGNINIPSSNINGSTITGTTIQTLASNWSVTGAVATFAGSTANNQIQIADNLADALNIKSGATTLLQFVTTTGAYALNFGQKLIFNNGNVTFNGSSGTNLVNIPDSAADALSFYDVTTSQRYLQFITSTGAGNQKIKLPQGQLEFSSTTSQSIINLVTNLADALNIKDTSGSFLQFVSTSGTPSIQIGKSMATTHGTLAFNATSGSNILALTDNFANALDIKNGAISLLNFTTSTGSQSVNIGVATTFANNVTINGNTYLNGGIKNKLSTLSSNTTIDSSYNTINVNASSGAITITLPSVGSEAGREYKFVKTDNSSNVVTIVPASGDSVDGVVDDTIILDSQYDHCAIQSHGSPFGWFIY